MGLMSVEAYSLRRQVFKLNIIVDIIFLIRRWIMKVNPFKSSCIHCRAFQFLHLS